MPGASLRQKSYCLKLPAGAETCNGGGMDTRPRTCGRKNHIHAQQSARNIERVLS